MSHRVLVTGGGGFLGEAIVRQLLARGYAVRSFSRGDYPQLRAAGVDTVRGDLGDARAVRGATAGCDTVFHVAALAGMWGDYARFHAANVVGTEAVIAACLAEGVARLIYTSSPSVVQTDGDCEGGDATLPYPPRYRTHYQTTKALGEQRALAANGAALATVALRPRLIWGPGDNHLVPRLVARAQAGRLRLVGPGDRLVDTTYIDDAAAAHLCAFDRLVEAERTGSQAACAGRAYFVSSGEPRPFRQVLGDILVACGESPVTRRVPPWLAFALGGLLEAAWTVLPLSGEPQMTRFLARQLSTANWYDLSATRRDLGYTPAVTWEAGLERLATWWAART